MPGHKCVQYGKINFGGSGPGTKMESNVGSAESNQLNPSNQTDQSA